MLKEEFKRIKNSHREALIKRAARVVLGSSVIRVFNAGTRDSLLPTLADINADTLPQIKTQEEYSVWFDRNVEVVAQEIILSNQKNSRIMPGAKWGHATKIMALMARELVLNSRYFTDKEVERISPFLYVPIDRIVMDRMRQLKIKLPFTQIRQIDTREKFYGVQEALGQAAVACKIPRVWFDDNWGDRQQ